MFAKLIVRITKKKGEIREIKVSQKFHVIRYCWEQCSSQKFLLQGQSGPYNPFFGANVPVSF